MNGNQSMRLFITGATGYIGMNVSIAFRRVGYRVFGLTRSREKATLLECNEIIPVLGNIQEPQGFEDVLSTCGVIVHAALDPQADTASQDQNLLRFILEATKNETQPKTLIYTSCVWVLGNTMGRPLTERSPYAPFQMVSWRPQIEQLVLGAKHVRGVVIRPGVVYGKRGGLTGMWFHGVTNGNVVRIAGDGHNRWAMVHVDDLARAYLLAARSKLGCEAFNIVDNTRNTVLEMASAAAQAAGCIHQIEFIPQEDAKKEMGAAYAEALAVDQIVDASKARELLGWQPAHRGFIPEVATYFRAWKANQSTLGL